MQALIEFIVRNLLALWPIAQVDEWKIAMMVRNGRIHRSLGPGLHWRWLFIEHKVDYPATEVVLSLPACAVTTADGRSVVVDANIGYRLTDIAKSWRSLWNLEKSIIAAASGMVASEIATKQWADLSGENRPILEREIMAVLAAFAESTGATIVRLHLVACVEAKQHRHFIDGALSR